MGATTTTTFTSGKGDCKNGKAARLEEIYPAIFGNPKFYSGQAQDYRDWILVGVSLEVPVQRLNKIAKCSRHGRFLTNTVEKIIEEWIVEKERNGVNAEIKELVSALRENRLEEFGDYLENKLVGPQIVDSDPNLTLPGPPQSSSILHHPEAKALPQSGMSVSDKDQITVADPNLEKQQQLPLLISIKKSPSSESLLRILEDKSDNDSSPQKELPVIPPVSMFSSDDAMVAQKTAISGSINTSTVKNPLNMKESVAKMNCDEAKKKAEKMPKKNESKTAEKRKEMPKQLQPKKHTTEDKEQKPIEDNKNSKILHTDRDNDDLLKETPPREPFTFQRDSSPISEAEMDDTLEEEWGRDSLLDSEECDTNKDAIIKQQQQKQEGKEQADLSGGAARPKNYSSINENRSRSSQSRSNNESVKRRDGQGPEHGLGPIKKPRIDPRNIKEDRRDPAQEEPFHKLELDSLGYSRFHRAIKANRLKTVMELIDAGVDVNFPSRDKLRNTPLHLAALYIRNRNETIPMLKILIDHGAKVDAENSRHETFMDILLLCGNAKRSLADDHPKLNSSQFHELVTILIDAAHGEFLVAPCEGNGTSILHWAMKKGIMGKETLEYLKREGFNLNYKTKFGNSILYYAIWGGAKIDMIEYLVSLDVDWGYLNNSRWNILHVSAQFCHLSAFEYFINLKPGFVKNVNKDWKTPLDILRKTCGRNNAYLIKVMDLIRQYGDN